MKILLLSQWYPPEPQRIISELAETLNASDGNEVDVLTGFPNYPSGELYPGYRVKLYQIERMNGIRVLRVPLYPEHSSSGVKRALNYFSFCFSVMCIAPFLLKTRYDAMHVVHPPLTTALAGVVLSRLKGIPFTMEIQDMWPETLRSTGMVNSERILDGLGRLAKWIYEKAAAIRVITPGFRDNLISKGVPAHKIHVISNWVDSDYYKPVAYKQDLAEKLGLAGRFNFMFAGGIGLAQGLDTVLKAADIIRDRKTIQIVFVGDGIHLPALKEMADKMNLENVKFLGRFPSEAMPDLFAIADVLLVTLKNDPLFRITIPHKTFAYLSSQKPVLTGIDGSIADVIRNAGAGLVCKSGSPEELAQRMTAFSEMDREKRAEMGRAGREAACSIYSKAFIVHQINQMIRSVAKNGRG